MYLQSDEFRPTFEEQLVHLMEKDCSSLCIWVKTDFIKMFMRRTYQLFLDCDGVLDYHEVVDIWCIEVVEEMRKKGLCTQALELIEALGLPVNIYCGIYALSADHYAEDSPIDRRNINGNLVPLMQYFIRQEKILL
jgi:hypothetical protein